MRFRKALTGTLLIVAGVAAPSFPSRIAAAESACAPGESPFACNRDALDPAARRRHFDELGPAIRAKIRTVRELPDGYEFELPGDSGTYAQVTEWSAGERACCPFFDIAVVSEREGGALWLRLTGRSGVKQFIEVDGAAWIRR
ncbi:MAG TPA: hypothetical protein VFL12_05090 [Thermoanaerobaculia bacterium]|nr:hypothetical protein [Thermoanaerobaculia bacterium]